MADLVEVTTSKAGGIHRVTLAISAYLRTIGRVVERFLKTSHQLSAVGSAMWYLVTVMAIVQPSCDSQWRLVLVSTS